MLQCVCCSACFRAHCFSASVLRCEFCVAVHVVVCVAVCLLQCVFQSALSQCLCVVMCILCWSVCHSVCCSVCVAARASSVPGVMDHHTISQKSAILLLYTTHCNAHTATHTATHTTTQNTRHGPPHIFSKVSRIAHYM